ncbi:hypothetical protein Rsub_12367 [Raphidocelis subcapitata]|uniref:Uncharacterized protein n=1 Tax=Raphidocelis subcapitata TaxID=307507 RepID=A0A2V0PIC0_9CHLO|nr:hypothetical protein Rsub_12367 [Raphidocelis subcapitata]|eukprot:GBF99561.1 hypothetical protein Rsub_12367 [Raphidocelis subcapitata]
MAPARRPQLLWAAVVVLLLPAAPGALGLACTDTSACPANQCCNTFATAPFSCVAGPFVGGVQVCSCVGLEAKGLKCPADKPYCCGTSGLCVADVATCTCTDSTTCPKGSCCSKPSADWASATSLGTCSLAPFSADGKYCQCSPVAKLNGVACPACCKLDNRCSAQATDCDCYKAFQCPKGSCCSRRDWFRNVRGKCSTEFSSADGSFCKCSEGMNGVACTYCCFPTGLCTASYEACPCSGSYDCVDNNYKYAGCCSKTLAQWKGADSGRGYCSRQLLGGPSDDAFCDCAEAVAHGVSCPASSQAGPVATCCILRGVWPDLSNCPRGQCAAKAADCDFTVNAVRVSKYQAHHLYYLDALANLTATADNTIWNGGKYKRPSPGDYYDFRGFVEVGSPDENGLPLACRNRYDNSTGTSFRGLDLKTAAGPLAWAADVAAQLWFSECKAITQCKADMAKDDVTLADMKQWTKLAGDRILSYLQIAPGGRNLLCPPRAYFGFFYQTFVRPPSPQASFFGLFNWATALTPSLIRIKNSAGAEEMVSALQLLQRNAELSLYIPEPLFAMEGLIELLIGQDHSLVQSFPPPILPASTPAFAFEPALTEGAPAAVDGAAPEATPVVLASTDIPAPEAAAAASALAPADAVAAEAAAAAAAAAAALAPADSAPALAVGAPALDTAPASEVVAPVEAMDAGPVAPASYAENGFVAGLANPELLNLAVGTTWAAGCAVDNVRCAAKSLGLLGAQSEAAGAAPAGAVAELAGDGAQIMGGNKTCLMQMRTLQLRLQSAKDMCTYRSAGAWVHPDPAQRVFAIERPIWDIQIEKGYAVYAYACSLMPEPALKYCKMSQSSLEDYMEKYSAMLATMRSITCDTAATSYRHVNVLGDGKAFPVIRGGGTGGGCTKVASNFISDVGCTLVDFVYDRYNAAVECCAGDCSTRPECALFSGGLATRINIPSCGGDGDPASFVKMPAGFAMPAASGAACGGGDGKGYWGWGVWSA